jgi:hypothetical protein
MQLDMTTGNLGLTGVEEDYFAKPDLRHHERGGEGRKKECSHFYVNLGYVFWKANELAASSLEQCKKDGADRAH